MDMEVSHFNAPAGVIPCEYPYKPYLSKKRILPDAENQTIVSLFVWTQYWNVSDGRTDGQTDKNGLAITTLSASNADAL